MGDRGQVKFIFTSYGKKKDKDKECVYFYTHWSASELEDTVRRALARRQRWDDDEYLARIIFSEMIKDEVDEEAGYGIGHSEHGGIWKLVTVNCNDQTVEVYNKSDDEESTCCSFEEFIKQ